MAKNSSTNENAKNSAAVKAGKKKAESKPKNKEEKKTGYTQFKDEKRDEVAQVRPYAVLVY